MSSFPHLQSATTSDSTSWPEEAAQRVHGRTVNHLVQRSSSVTSSWPEVAAQRIPGRTETCVVQRRESATSTAEDEQTDPGSASFTLQLERRESSQITTCPLSAHVAILTSGGAEILRFPSNLSNGDVEGLAQFETEKYADAILRWPYCVLITAARSRAEFVICDASGRHWFEDLGAILHEYPFSSSEIALTGSGQVALLYTYTQIRLYDNSNVHPSTYPIPPEFTRERFSSVHFNNSGDLLLACGGRYFFLWEKETQNWHDNAHEEPRTGRIPWSRVDVLKAVSFRQRRGFVLYDEQGLFAVFVMGKQILPPKAIQCADIMSAVISPDDHHLFYIKRVRQNRFRLGGQRWTLQLFQRTITGTSIGDERCIPELGNLQCDERTVAHLCIRQTEALEDLVIVTTKGQVQSIAMSQAIVRRNSTLTST